MKDTEYKRVYKVRDETGKEYIKNFCIYEINMEIAKNLLNKNMSVEDIMDITGLTREEIENCKR